MVKQLVADIVKIHNLIGLILVLQAVIVNDVSTLPAVSKYVSLGLAALGMLYAVTGTIISYKSSLAAPAMVGVSKVK